MSRAAAMQSNKKEQKAAIADKNAEKERLAALGMNKSMKQMVGDDVLLCTSCGATKLGPDKCECKGGVVRPGSDYCPIAQLIDAAKKRGVTVKAEQMKDAAGAQKGVAHERAKRKGEKDKLDLDTEFQGNDIEMLNTVEFPVGKFGMDIEKNSICKVADSGNAHDLGVKAGWVIAKVNGENVPPNKKDIVKAAAAAMKAGPIMFGFRVAVIEGYHHCGCCDKFLEAEKFEESQISDQGPGKQVCSGCEEFADMGDYE